ncbi:hypothetical protein PORY_001578 [Pneumocystis oryctolagi]|uniref:Uncharacterized protein n=1 Tax=Pneumocystis oryctolagi TaxID=42067 RepID=A0ACB7CBG1_9ASCO|nr:hypothetical protein PORY_001578 [Pneumocystis oryctolagi]
MKLDKIFFLCNKKKQNHNFIKSYIQNLHHRNFNSSRKTCFKIEKKSYESKNEDSELTKSFILSNGVRVVSKAIPGHFSTLGVYIDAGSRYEYDNIRGASHLIDRLSFKATKNRSAKDMINSLESLGGNFMCSCSRESLMYQTAVFNSDVEDMVKLLSETILDPVITEEDLEEQKLTVQYEITEITSKPELILPEMVHITAFKNNTLGNPLLCPEERLPFISLSTISDYRNLFYRPERMVVAFVGIEHEKARDLAEKYFGDFKTKETSYNSFILKNKPLELLFQENSPSKVTSDTSLLSYGTSRQEIFLPAHYTGGVMNMPLSKQNQEFTHIYIAFEGMPLSDPDIYALATLQILLGGGGSFSAGGPGKGMYSRLFLNVLNQYGWIENCTSFNHSYTDSGIFGISASCKHDAAQALVNIICQELAFTMHKGRKGINKIETERAKNQLRSSLMMNLESKMIILEDLGRQTQIMSNKKITAQEMCDKISSLTVNDLQNVAEKIFTGLIKNKGQGTGLPKLSHKIFIANIKNSTYNKQYIKTNQEFKLNIIKKTFFSTHLKIIQNKCFKVTYPTRKYSKEIIKKRFNELGIQHISSNLHSQLFPGGLKEPNNELIEVSRKHLAEHNLLGKNTEPTEDIELDLPPLQGKNLDEHFYRIAMEVSEPYLSYSKQFASITLPIKPNSWVIRSGWTKYNSDGTTKPIEYPNERSMVFDVEVLYKDSPFAVIACAATENAWYGWLSPWLTEESESPRQLIPIGDIGKRIIVGHNIGYDRIRTKEEYSIEKKENAFIDTMSLHIAVNGMCSRQKSTWIKHKKYKELKEKFQKESTPTLLKLLEQLEENDGDLWMYRSSSNSLQEVAQFHCHIKPNKYIRTLFEKLDKKSVQNQLNMFMNYCANDVDVTHKIYKNVFPSFLEVCPHPASFGALLKISSSFLPVDKSWESYIARSEKIFQNLSKSIHERLLKLIENALNQKNNENVIKSDPWLRQLDWTTKPIRMVIDKKTGEKRLAKKQKKPGFPNWYKNLFSSDKSEINITVRSRIAPLLLRLNWEGHPLVWSNKYGWTFRVIDEKAVKKFLSENFLLCNMKNESLDILRQDTDATYFKIPNKNGPSARCGSPLSKSYIKAFEDGLLSSEISYAREALDMNAACSYWISSRERIMSQLVIWNNEIDIGLKNNQNILGIILPQIIPMGTITRRAVENTWLTASNIKRNRVGSELKAMIKAPSGYKFVGADVDSEELWIASLFGDSQFKMHGATAIGWMTIEGTKSAETDMHSVTAKILGISRDNAKIFNYSRIYGAGIRFAIQLLQRFNPKLSEKQAKEIATKLYDSTKGKKSKITRILSKENEKKSALEDFSSKHFWHGGTESYVFNMLEEIANQEIPQTPVLGCSITEALLLKNISPGGFMTSRINWAIQSSGVDYLHLLIISMEYLIETYKINARLVLTVHDEIRYLVHEDDKYILALALQISNLWTRAMFSEKLGINDVPQSCAFFSSIDIDHVLRKETNMDCITPSNPEKIPHGESLNIYQLLEKISIFQKHFLKRGTPSSTISSWNYVEKKTLPDIQKKNNLLWLKVQAIKNSKELEKLTFN